MRQKEGRKRAGDNRVSLCYVASKAERIISKSAHFAMQKHSYFRSWDISSVVGNWREWTMWKLKDTTNTSESFSLIVPYTLMTCVCLLVGLCEQKNSKIHVQILIIFFSVRPCPRNKWANFWRDPDQGFFFFFFYIFSLLWDRWRFLCWYYWS